MGVCYNGGMKGQVVYIYAFDVASEIDLKAAQEGFSKRAEFFKGPADKGVPRDFPFHQPLTLYERPIERNTTKGKVRIQRDVKVFTIGAISVSFRVDFEVAGLRDLLPYHELALEGKSLDALAVELCEATITRVEPFAKQLSAAKNKRPEAYTVFSISDLGDPQAASDAQAWLSAHRREVAGLLTEESDFERLSHSEVDETVRHSYSYTVRDLLVVDWNSALIVDEEGTPDDVLYVIEMANLQLNEYRHYDQVLEAALDRAYIDVESYSRKPPLFAEPRQVLRSLREVRIDLTKMSEELDNITKFFGDWHLARLYLGCSERFHLNEWQGSLAAKLKTLDGLYKLLMDEMGTRRMLVLEAAIVLLFIVDLIILATVGG